MSRRKIRMLDYPLEPHEILVTPGMVFGCKTKPRLGRGGGRAAGARSSVHSRLHKFWVCLSTEDCPICRFGMNVWKLWLESQRVEREEWIAFWEGREDEKAEFLKLVSMNDSEERRLMDRYDPGEVLDEIPGMENNL